MTGATLTRPPVRHQEDTLMLDQSPTFGDPRLPARFWAFEYRWTLSVQISNGMTRGLMGFGNWIPVLVYARPGESLYTPQRDAAVIPIVGDMPNHPSPKPERAMSWIVQRFPNAQTILDPFMGSGTTLRAAKDLGRYAIGIENRREVR